MSLLGSANRVVVRDDLNTDDNYEDNIDATTSSGLPESTGVAKNVENAEKVEESSTSTTTSAPIETPVETPLLQKIATPASEPSAASSSSSAVPTSEPTVEPSRTTPLPLYPTAPLPKSKPTNLSDNIYNNIIVPSTLSTSFRSAATPAAYQIPTNPVSIPLAAVTAGTTPLSTPTIAPSSSSSSNATMKVAIPVAAGVGSFVVLGGLSLAMSMRYRRGKWPFKNNEAFVEMRDDPLNTDVEKIDAEKRQKAKWDPSRSNDRISRFIQRAL
ncbi:hypothetical protein BROUX41_004919 [Berkeleyomyces rouxiae]|uniref:uncharacterized protein n=1 Tax=Berkeleyomyces rouxiae TaxID=2035830 RepID=UPI003B7C0C41